MNGKTENMKTKKESAAKTNADENAKSCGGRADAERMFAKKGREIVRSGMALILNRLRFAKRCDAEICRAINCIEEDEELKASQKKMLTDALKNAAVMNTGEVLSLVTEILGRLGASPDSQGGNEVIVTLDERVEKWAQ